jgi:putative peptidoglycan lipid II flippase
MGLNVIFSFAFSALFSRIGWMPHGGLALANSLATALEAVTLFILMRRRLNGIQGKEIATGFVQAWLGTLGMGLGLWFWLQVMASRATALTALGGVLLGGFLFGLIVWLIKVPEVQSLILAIQRRIIR